MKQNILRPLFSFALIVLSTFAFAQTADEIISEHIKAHGGMEKFNSVSSMTLHGVYTAFSLEKDFHCQKTKEGYYFADFHMGEKKVTEAFDGTKGWTIDLWEENEYARQLNEAENNVFLQKAELITPFFSYKEKGSTVEYKGIDTIDGMQMYVLQLTRSNKKIETWYLHTKTYLEYHYTSEWVDFQRGLPAETYFDDFREVNGLLLPHYISRTFWQRDRVWQIESIEFNKDFDKSVLPMPHRPQMDKLKFMEGDWNVKVEVMTRSGKWYPISNTSSQIAFTNTNLLTENISYQSSSMVNKITSIAYIENLENYRITIFNDYNCNTDIYQGTLSDSSFVFNDIGISFVDSIKPNYHMQYVIKDWSPTGFILQRYVSVDGGSNWQVREQFTYTRKE